MTQERIPFSVGTIVLGGGALVLFGFLALGFVLPTRWQAEASALLPATPDAVFGYLDSPEGWQAWTPWPDSGLVREGPARGAGAGMSWDDPELGSGRFRLVEVDAPARVAYEVDVGSAGMHTSGSVALSAVGEGVRVTWREEGDLGRNPLMGYWAFFMERAQTTELEKGLVRLGELAAGTGRPPETPADSGSSASGR